MPIGLYNFTMDHKGYIEQGIKDISIKEKNVCARNMTICIGNSMVSSAIWN